LSEKITNRGLYEDDFLEIDDVKEFIKELKEFALNRGKIEKGEADYTDGYYDGTWDFIHILNDWLDKIAGKGLVWNN